MVFIASCVENATPAPAAESDSALCIAGRCRKAFFGTFRFALRAPLHPVWPSAIHPFMWTWASTGSKGTSIATGSTSESDTGPSISGTPASKTGENASGPSVSGTPASLVESVPDFCGLVLRYLFFGFLKFAIFFFV